MCLRLVPQCGAVGKWCRPQGVWSKWKLEVTEDMGFEGGGRGMVLSAPSLMR